MSGDRVADLLTLVAAQDRAAFRELYGAASSKLFGTLLRILGTRSEAEDALQEVFTRVWLNARRFDSGRGAGMTWLIAIARNHAIDRLRARPSARQFEDEDAVDRLVDDVPGVESRLVALGETGRIVECFGTLETDRADAIRLAYLQGWSYQALSGRYGVPLNTIRTWLRRGLIALRECMDR